METTTNMVEMTPEATAEAVETPEKLYTLRNIEFGDAFIVVNIISKAGFSEFKDAIMSDPVRGAISQMTKDGTDADSIVEAAGASIAFDIAGIIFANLNKCENDVYNLLGSMSGMKPNEIKKLPPEVAFEMIIDIIQGVNFKGFMKVVSKLLK